MSKKKFIPRPPNSVFSESRVVNDLSRLAGQLDSVYKVEPDHPFHRKFFEVCDEATNKQQNLMRLRTTIHEAEQNQKLKKDQPEQLSELKTQQEDCGNAWRNNWLKSSVAAMMCRDYARGRIIDEIHSDAYKHLRVQAMAYDDLEKPLDYLPRPFVESDMYTSVEIFIDQIALMAKSYQDKIT